MSAPQSSQSQSNDVLDFLDSLDVHAVPAAPAPVATTLGNTSANANTNTTGSPSIGMGQNPFAPAVTAAGVSANPFLSGTPSLPAAVSSPSAPTAPLVATTPPAVASTAATGAIASPKLGHARSGSSSSLRAAGAAASVNMPPLAGSPSATLVRPSTPGNNAGVNAATNASNSQLNPYTPPAAASPAAGTASLQQSPGLQGPTAATASPGGGWSSWFSSVTATVSTVVSPELVSRARETALKVGDQLLHETQHAQAVASRALTQASSVAANVTAQARDRANNNPTTAAAVAQGSKLLGMVSQSVTGLLDVVAPETLELAVTVKVDGLCNVDEVAKDTVQVLETVFAARDMRLIVDELVSANVRKYLPEETPDFTPDLAWSRVHPDTQEPIPDTHIHVHIHPMRPLASTSSLLAYLVRVTGSGPFSAVTVSQSFHAAGPHADPEWTRMVLRSAVRTTVDDWLAELVAADPSENRFSAARSRADGATNAASVQREVVSDEQQLVQAIGSI